MMEQIGQIMTEKKGTTLPDITISMAKKPRTGYEYENGYEVEPGLFYWYGQKLDKKTLDSKVSLENRERQWAKEAKARSQSEDHEHKFTVPVEWHEYPMRTTTIKIKKVTKLRCDCGQEIKR